MKIANFIPLLLIAVLWTGVMLPAGKAKIKIALVFPSLTKDLMYKTDPSFNPTEEWELFFLSHNYNYEMLDDVDLDDISSDVSVIVLPSLEVISRDILDELKQQMRSGRGVLITGNFAEFDERGKRRTGNHNDLPGFDILSLGKTENLSLNHYLEGSTPFSEGLKPGQKILVSVKPGLFYASGLSGSARPEGSYLVSVNDYPGIVSNSGSDGRLLWLGFGLGQLIDKNVDVLLSNTLQWLSSLPEAFINYWPLRYTCCTIFYKNINRISDLDNIGKVPANGEKLNYFITPALLEKNQDHLSLGIDSINLNIYWDDFLFSQLKPDEKNKWLEKIRTDLNKIKEQHFVGIFSEGEFMDPDMYHQFNKTGYSFIFTSGYSDSFSFDYDTTSNLYFFERRSSGIGMRQMMKSDLNSGGIFYVDKDSAGENYYLKLMEQNCWITTFSDLIEWAEKRENLSADIVQLENDDYEINIKNNGRLGIQDAGVWISVPRLNRKTTVSVAGDKKILTFDPEKEMYYLTLPIIGGLQERSFRIQVND